MNQCWILSNDFFHQFIWSCGFSCLAYRYGELYWLIFKYWTSLAFLGKTLHSVRVYNSFHILLNFICGYFIKELDLYLYGIWVYRAFVVVLCDDFGFKISMILASKWVAECSILFYFLKDFFKYQYYFFFKCFIVFTAESIWTWTFLWDIFNY